MTRIEQKHFVRSLAAQIVREITEQISAGKIPAEWDGHELRELLYAKAHDSRSHIMQTKGNARRREFDNTVLVNNL